MAYRLGVDVGGTFTDLLLFDDADGRFWRHKTPSTPHDSSEGVITGVRDICAQAGIAAAAVGVFLHGTTVATNAVLEGKGAHVGLVVTEGYRQMMQIARSLVPGGLAAWIIWPKPEPMARLEDTVEVKGRLDAQGRELRPLDDADIRRQLLALKGRNIEALTVSLINAYVDGRHERRVAELAAELLPGVPVSLSHVVLPEMQEYERTLTTVANAAVRPIVGSYVARLRAGLRELGMQGRIALLRSDGGLMSSEAAEAQPVSLLMSGPAGGVTGALWVARHAGLKNILTLDVGGTSTDVALIENGEPRLVRTTQVGHLTVRVSALDVKTVGAGGGSIAKIPELTRALRVGPESAGAVPGPVAYGRGGTLPTVTDANVVLGYLPENLLGGSFKLDREAARAAVQGIADALGVDLFEAARGIIDIVNENMFGALRMISVQQGYDPRDFALMGFGGAGPLHVNAVAKLMGSWPAISPVSPGVLCALGDATTRMRSETARSFSKLVSRSSEADVSELLKLMRDQVRDALVTDGLPAAELELRFEADLRYAGQAFEVPIAVQLADFDAPGGLARLADAFHEAHRRLFTFSMDTETELVNLRAVALGRAPELPALALAEGNGDPTGAKLRDHQMWFDGAFRPGAIYERSKLRAGDRIPGPAIVCEMDATTVILGDCAGLVDTHGNILINPFDRQRTMPARIVETNPAPLAPARVDPITLDILENALRNARVEMDATLFRTALSPGIREQGDAFPLIADRQGRMVVGQFGSFLDGFLRQYKGDIEEGDVILLNDPYSCEGAISHINDQLVIVPIFRAGRLMAWAAMFGHMTDVGGKVPGSLPTDAGSIYEEGFRLPPVKLYRRGEFQGDILAIAANQSRMPEWYKADLHALVAACRVATRRVVEMCERFGDEVFDSAVQELLARNHRAMKHLIGSQIGEAPVSFEDYVCDDGMGHGPFKIKCTMWREGGIDNPRVILDFAGTDPQSTSSINFYLNENMFKMFFGIYMIMVFDPQILFNDGFYDLVDVRIPEGSLLKPRFPAALSCRTHALGRIFDVLGALLGQKTPEFLCAAGFSSSPHLMFSGTHSEGEKAGEWFQLFQIGFGGIPGRPFGDGPDGHSLFPGFTNVPNEFLERYFPMVIERYETVADSGGAGKFRGGNGIHMTYRFTEAGRISIHDDRWFIPPWGVNGGEPAKRSWKLLERPDGGQQMLPSKCDNVLVQPGDLLHFVTWGAGGWGDPLEREPALVALEVRRGLVSVQGALAYGVVLDAQGAVSDAATLARRAELRATRGPLGVFNRGPDIETLRQRCEAETGLPAPVQPKRAERVAA